MTAAKYLLWFAGWFCIGQIAAAWWRESRSTGVSHDDIVNEARRYNAALDERAARNERRLLEQRGLRSITSYPEPSGFPTSDENQRIVIDLRGES